MGIHQRIGQPRTWPGRFYRRLRRTVGEKSTLGRKERVLFLYCGKSRSWREPGRRLYRTNAAFRERIQAVDDITEPFLGVPASAAFSPDWRSDSWEQEVRADIICISLTQMALTDVWRDAGVAPTAVGGLSGGEIAASYVAGAITFEEAARIISSIAIRVEHKRGSGNAFQVRANAAQAARLCRSAPGPLEVAGEVMPGVWALMTPASHAEANRAFLEGCAEVVGERTEVDRYHVPSTGFDGPGHAADTAGLSPVSPRLPIYLSSLGDGVPPDHPLDARHWSWMVTSPYRLAGAAKAARDDGVDKVVVIGPPAIGRWFCTSVFGSEGRRLIKPFEAAHEDPVGDAFRLLRKMKIASPPARQAADIPLSLTSPQACANPARAYDALRASSPIHHLESENVWVVLGHAEMRAICAQPAIFSNDPYDYLDGTLIGADPPSHGPVRALVSRLFSKEALTRAAAVTAETSRRLIKPRFDLVSEYAEPLSAAVAADRLGLDDAQLDVVTALRSSCSQSGELIEALDEHAPSWGVYRWLLSEAEGTLSEAQARCVARFLWMAAITTTERMIVHGMIELLANETLAAEIRADRDLLRPFTEEMLRLRPPEHMLPRRATRDVEIANVKIPANAKVLLCISAANRDPAIFEAPNELRLGRSPNKHLSFGSGIHHCSGAALARVVVPTAIETLLNWPDGIEIMEPLTALTWCKNLMTLTPLGLVVTTGRP